MHYFQSITKMDNWPKNVGIKSMEVYFPYYYVSQEKLEQFDNVSPGKYTIGLGQQKMGFCTDREDINSLCLTVLHNLIDRQNIDLKNVGRLDVGTETIIDKSKSVKTVLMQLFEESGNTDIEGIDTTNACFGGTAALFNAINWVESSSWDGRLAIVVIGDIAIYAEGNARCTGGVGAIALIVGPDAPLVIDRGLKSTHMAHAYDFYKPNMSSEYPVIDGQLSLKCYLSALDICYKRYGEKFAKQFNLMKPFSLSELDYMVFHAPYCKLVQKSIGRCLFNDFTKSLNDVAFYEKFIKYKGITLEESYGNTALFKEIEKVSVECSKDIFQKKTAPSLEMATNIGNMYTSSLYGCLCSLLQNCKVPDLLGKRIVLFSYGSGLASSMFSLTVTDDQSDLENFIHSLHSVKERLLQRKELEPTEFVKILEIREQNHNAKSYNPQCSVDDIFPGTYYLRSVDEKFRRFYNRK